jgi:hypothetical protein
MNKKKVNLLFFKKNIAKKLFFVILSLIIFINSFKVLEARDSIQYNNLTKIEKITFLKKEILKARIEILKVLIKRKALGGEIKLLAPKDNKIYFAAFPDFGGSEENVESQIISDFEKLSTKKIA